LWVLAIDLSKIASDLRLMVMGRAHRRDHAAGCSAWVVDHAREDQPIHPGDGESGVLPGDGLRYDGGHRVRAWAARAERDDAGHRVQRLLSMRILTNATTVLADKCVKGIQANRDMCAYWVERSAALATALAPQIGYAKAADISKRSGEEGILIRAGSGNTSSRTPRSTTCSI
jgi:hypothetical protein